MKINTKTPPPGSPQSATSTVSRNMFSREMIHLTGQHFKLPIASTRFDIKQWIYKPDCNKVIIGKILKIFNNFQKNTTT
jgi:hypothetical protein